MEFEDGYPPEVNSGNMYAGPGSQSLRAAAWAWRSLGKELTALQWRFNQILGDLMERWSGVVANQVMEAAKPFVKWLADLSAQLSEIERQIYAILAAYQWAHDGVVHPTVIAANRVRRAELINDNTLGRNDAAIARLDQQYEDFWDQDGYVMRNYRDSVRDALLQLTPWQQPPPIANNTGLVAPEPLITGS